MRFERHHSDGSVAVVSRLGRQWSAVVQHGSVVTTAGIWPSLAEAQAAADHVALDVGCPTGGGRWEQVMRVA